MSQEIFKEYFDVRDNEIDVQGIVNNTNYMVYLGHARHKYIEQKGIDFNEYAKCGLNLVLISCQLNFKQSLRPNDKFYVTCKVIPTDSAIRFSFYQEIRLVKDDTLILTGELIAACVNEKATSRKDKFCVPEEIQKLLSLVTSDNK